MAYTQVSRDASMFSCMDNICDMEEAIVQEIGRGIEPTVLWGADYDSSSDEDVASYVPGSGLPVFRQGYIQKQRATGPMIYQASLR